MTPEDERIERLAFREFACFASEWETHYVDWNFMQHLWYRCTEEMREFMREYVRAL